MPVSIKDVARYAKVVPSTVSLVLNNNKDTAIKISAATRQRVTAAAEKLGYRANPMARSLRTKKTGMIGLVVNSETFQEPLIKLAEHEMAAAGYEIILSAGEWNTPSEEAAIQRLLKRYVDGIMLLSPSVDPGHHDLVESLIARHYPLIAVGPSVIPGLEHVDWNRHEAYRRITLHLLQQGCLTIAFFGGQDSPGVQQRIAGIRSAIQEHPKATFTRLGHQPGWDIRYPRELGPLLSESLRRNALQAVICHTDQRALLVMKAARELGWRIPADLAVTGCSNSDWSAFLEVPLTTIRFPREAMLAWAWRRLQARLEKSGRTDGAGENPVLSAELIVRESSMYQKKTEN